MVPGFTTHNLICGVSTKSLFIVAVSMVKATVHVFRNFTLRINFLVGRIVLFVLNYLTRHLHHRFRFESPTAPLVKV
jgi:hypothetical protein